MLSAVRHWFDKHPNLSLLVVAMSSVLLSSIGWILDVPLLAYSPIAIIVAIWSIYDFSILYYALFLSLPLCMEFYIGSFTTDVPTEPIMMALLVILLVKNLVSPSEGHYWKHPFMQLLGLQFIWWCIVLLYSTVPFISLKYVLAKLWYIAAFIGVTFLVVKDVKRFKIVFWCLFLPTFFTIVYTLIRHYLQGFTFESSNHVMGPFFRNHVDYACLLSLLFPFLFVARTWYRKGDLLRYFIDFNIILFLVAIWFSYTRTSWLAVFVALGAYFIFKWKMIKPALAVAAVLAVVALSYLFYENRFLRYAPDFKKTIYHSSLSDHLESTSTLNDVSSAERLYRWVAATQMIKARPLTGFGQGGFVANYRDYAVSLFTTYVSRNFEHSTVHNYFLFLLTEQGIPGFLLFLVFIVFIYIRGQKIYIETQDPEEKKIVLAVLVALVVMLFDNMLSDLIEDVKIGPIFYWLIALLVMQDRKNLVKSERGKVNDE